VPNINVVEQLSLFDLKSRSQSKELGQFFTESKTADYMASMFNSLGNINVVKLLDAGAGEGVLTESAALRCLELGYRQVYAVLYEIDEGILPILKENMDQLVRTFIKKGGSLSYEIINEDFVLSRPDKDQPNFHISIINPPYFKYNSKHSIYSGATGDLFKGNPNIYASFMAVVSSCLASLGQMVAIIPRSFTNGLYFEGFRKYLQSQMSLERAHIFQSRNRLFKKMGVLQENIICKFVKREQRPTIEISSSTCSEDLAESQAACYPQKLIIDRTNRHNIIRIPECAADGRILRIVENWPSSFEKNNYFISTGPVVEFRTREFITGMSRENSIPLLRMHNIKAFQIEWTGKHRKDTHLILKEGHEKYTSKNKVYVILKRFSSKDEKRRLVAGINDPQQFKNHLIGLENHLNYIGIKGEDMNLPEAFGLAALFNSTFMDRYFRSISGNTQVNATEMRLLKLPRREQIISIGKEVQRAKSYEQSAIDKIVQSALNIQDI
jgi:adenine-specific DNA-methyltransferase